MQETLTPLPDASPYLLAAYGLTLAVIGWMLVRRLWRLKQISRELSALQAEIQSPLTATPKEPTDETPQP